MVELEKSCQFCKRVISSLYAKQLEFNHAEHEKFCKSNPKNQKDKKVGDYTSEYRWPCEKQNPIIDSLPGVQMTNDVFFVVSAMPDVISINLR